MANTTYILEQIKLEDGLKDLLAKSNGENVQVTYNGGSKTLTAALAEILTSVQAAQTEAQVQAKITAAIDALIDSAPETYNTLKEIADYIAEDKTAAAAIETSLTGKVDKTAFEAFQNSIETLGTLAGKSQVTEDDLDEALKEKIDNAATANHTHTNKAELDLIKSGDVAKWDAKADKTPASEDADGLMTSADKKRLDGLRGVRYGTSAPEDMQIGELFVKVVEEE